MGEGEGVKESILSTQPTGNFQRFKKLQQGRRRAATAGSWREQKWEVTAERLGFQAGEEGRERVRAAEGGGGATARQGHAIGTRHSGLMVGNPADRDDRF